MYQDEILPATAVVAPRPYMKKPAATAAKPSANLAATGKSLPCLPSVLYSQTRIGERITIQIALSDWNCSGIQVRMFQPNRLNCRSTLRWANRFSEVDICW